jgi:uncharacterized membrane protein YhaH (DUF805 family)
METRRRKRRKRSRLFGRNFSAGVRMLFPPEIGRVSFLFRTVMCAAMALLVWLLAVSAMPMGYQLRDDDWGVWMLGFVPLIIIYVYALAFVLAPRLRDAGLPRISALLALIPILNVIVFAAALVLPTAAMAPEARRL